ncbi:MAG: hypothetical protein IKF79_03290, partial [Methanosphaera sp.]|nr:hypothetical protein [Methanosphaera sp.]
MNQKEKIFEKLYTSMCDDDPEYALIIKQFINNQLLTHIHLTDKEIMLAVISTMIANQSTKLYKEMLSDTLKILTPVEIKEIIYQSTIYIGLAKSYEFMEITNDHLKKEKIELPLESQKTIKD